MKKILILEACKDCPNYRYEVSDFHPPWPMIRRWCDIEKIEVKTAYDIPAWCPLESVQES